MQINGAVLIDDLMEGLQRPVWSSPDDWSPNGGLEFENLRIPASDSYRFRTILDLSPALRASIKVGVVRFRLNQDNVVGIDVRKGESPDNVAIAANDHWRGSGNTDPANVVSGFGDRQRPRV